jgi:hypothetical protein
MFSTTISTKLCSGRAAQLGRAAPLLHGKSLLAVGLISSSTPIPYQHGPARAFSTTGVARMRDFFPVKETEHIRTTPPAWKHHGYSYEDMLAVEPGHRVPVTLGDKAAWKFLRFCR